MILKYIQLSKLKTPLGKMAGIALKCQCDLDSIMVPPKVSMEEKILMEEKKILVDDEIFLFEPNQ